MEKAAVVAFRDALMAEGKHRSIRIAFDNGVNLSTTSDLVIWDDDKELVIGFIADAYAGSFVADLPVRIICSTYEMIQFIMANTNVQIKDEYKERYTLEDLPTLLDQFDSVTDKITEDQKKQIVKWFSRLFDGKYDLAHNAYMPTDIRRD